MATGSKKPAPKPSNLPGPKSWSQLEVYDTCHLQAKFRYVEKLNYPKPENYLFGSCFHDFRYRYYDHCRVEGVDSDWDAVSGIAKQAFHDAQLPLHRWDEFEELCRTFAENRPYNNKMGVEVRFGVNRKGEWCSFDEADYFRGIVDGLEIQDDEATITDTKTAMSLDLPFTQLEVYAAMMALRYPEVKRWRLVYDFARIGRRQEKIVLAENLAAIREHVRLRIARMEAEQKWKAQPGEHCAECSFLGICTYKMQNIQIITKKGEAAAAMEDYVQLAAQAKALKARLKKYVEIHGDVEGEKLKAAFFTREEKSYDKVNLVQALQKIGLNPLEFMEFPAESLKKLMYDDKIGDDVRNLIHIDPVPQFDIKKRKVEEEGS